MPLSNNFFVLMTFYSIYVGQNSSNNKGGKLELKVRISV